MTETSQYTPGPWMWEADGREQRTALRSSNGDCVIYAQADISGYTPSVDPWTDVSDADARLIAAAPDLLEALRAADEALAQVTAFEDDARYIMGNTNFEIVKLRRQEVRAAIAKATAQ